jgi:hypothetical protein
MLCMTSPAQAAFRDESRRANELYHRLCCLRQAGEGDATDVREAWLASNEEMLKLLARIEWQWNGLMGPEL